MTKLRTVFLCLLLPLLWGTPVSLSAQYIVGTCGGATHSTLQSAFNDVMTLTVSGTFTIDICSGTYVDQPAVLGPVTYAAGGGKILIRKNPLSFGSVILRANATSTNSLIVLDGAQNVVIRNIRFNVTYSASRTIFRLLSLQNGAGEVTVNNCVFDAYDMAGTGYNHTSRGVFCGVHVSDQDGDVSVLNSKFLRGGGGIFSESTATGASDKDLYVDASQFTENLFSGVSAVQYMDTVRVSNCVFTSTGNADVYAGIEVDFTPTEFVQADGNEMEIKNKGKATGISDRAYRDDIQDNTINAGEISNEFVGIWQKDFIIDCKIVGNEINYYRGIAGEVIDTTVTGIYVIGDYPSNGSHPGSSSLKISENQIVLDNHRDSYGIRVAGTGNRFQDEVICEDNNIIFNGTKQFNGVEAEGIEIYNIDADEMLVNGNRVAGYFGIPPICYGIEVSEVQMFGPMVALNNEVTFNTTRLFSNGMRFAGLVPDPGNPIYVGNNRVAMQANPSLTRGMAVDRCAMVYLHHNSIHMYSSSSSATGSIALDVTANNPQESYENRVYNNICSNSAGGKAVRFNQSYAVQLHDHNLYFSGSGPVLGEYAGFNASNLSSWQTATAQDANALSGDPLFTSNTDLHIPLGSPAYQTAKVFFYPSYASDLTSDFEGDSRGFMGNREIGADEKGLRFLKAAPETEMAFSISPNPSLGEVNIALATGEGEWTVRIMDMAGREMIAPQITTQSLRLDLSDLPAAVYLIQASRGSEIHHRKLILK